MEQHVLEYQGGGERVMCPLFSVFSLFYAARSAAAPASASAPAPVPILLLWDLLQRENTLL